MLPTRSFANVSPVASEVTSSSAAARTAASHRGLVKSARVIGTLTLASRILGLARDMTFSGTLGIGSESSAFWTAFQVPNLFRQLFGEGALSAASIPVLTGTLADDGHEAADRLAGRIIGLLLVVLTSVCIAAEIVVAGLYWYYRADSDSALILTLTALMLPYLIFICAAAMLGGVQNVFGRFASAASAPIILNVFMIAAALAGRWMWLRDLRPQVVLISAFVVISGICQLAWQWAAARRCRLRLRLAVETRDPAIRKIALTMLPMLAGLATIQFNIFLGSLIAWWLVPEAAMAGSQTTERVGPAILSFAQRLYQFPLGIFATALATAIFPALSRSAAQRDMPALSATLSRGLRVVSFEGIPCMVGLIAVREPLIRTLFAHGQFLKWGPEAVDRVALALVMYSLGIWAFGVNQLIVRAFYAVQDAKTPMWVSVRNVGLNLAMNIALVLTPLREAGLGLSASICAMIQITVLLRRFHHRYAGIEFRATSISVLRTLAASLVMWAAIALVNSRLSEVGSAMQLIVLVSTGGFSYLAAAWILHCEELRELLRR